MYTIFVVGSYLQTSMKTHMSVKKISSLLIFRKTITVYSENWIKSINALCDQNSELLNIKGAGGTVYSQLPHEELTTRLSANMMPCL